MHIKTLLSISLLGISSIATANIHVVAAENQYGNVAELIGGDKVTVTSIISNPNADPHQFTTSPSTAIKINEAQVIIYNGAGYDTWMGQLLNAKSSNNQLAIIDVADLIGAKEPNTPYGLNPHLWYNPTTFPAVAEKLTTTFSAIEPQNKAYFEANLAHFNQQYQQVYQLVNNIKAKYSGTPITATEPVYDYMANALGLKTLGLDYQWVTMNDSEPSPRMMMAYQDLFTQHKVKVLFYNSQVTDENTDHVKILAEKNGIPVVGVSETMPTDKNVITWLLSDLQATQAALAKSQP